MKAYLDTSVLVAAFYEDHERHEESFELFVEQDRQTGGTAGHCLAETYSVLTGMPGKHRVGPDEALLFLENINERLLIVALEPGEYFQCLQDFSSVGVTGSGIYDALLARSAIKVGAESIYTWNVKRFSRLGPEILARVRTP